MNASNIVKVDFHVHTIYSDGSITLEYLINKAKLYNFQVVSKADHNTTRGNERLKILAEKNNLIFIPSVEISTKQGHLVGINIDNWNKGLGGKNMQEQIDLVLELGGIPVIAHPYWRGGLGSKIFNLKNALGYELFNHSSPIGTLKLLKEQVKHPEKYKKFPQYAGSDAHGGAAFGKYYNEIYVNDLTKSEILESLFKRRIHCKGLNFLDNLIYWWKDGAPNQISQIHKLIYKYLEKK